MVYKDKNKAKEYRKKYGIEHKRESKEYQAQYYLEHRDYILNRNRKWRINNKAKVNFYAAKWAKANRDKRRKIVKRWRDKHKERELMRGRNDSLKYRKTSKYVLARRRYYYSVRLKLLQFFGGKCAKCGNTDPRVLQIDHIEGGGSTEYRIIKKGNYLHNKYRLTRTNPEQAKRQHQLLCANCNWIKRWENQECLLWRGQDGEIQYNVEESGRPIIGDN